MVDLFRILVAVMLVMHGISHIIWFLASWTSVPTGVGDGSWILPGEVTIRGRIGKALGLLALIVVVVFTTAGLMLAAGLETWSGVANIGVFLSYAARRALVATGVRARGPSRLSSPTSCSCSW